MKTNKKQVRKFLIILLVAQIINLGLFKGIEFGSQKLGTYIYSQTAQPFLAQALITHKDLATGLTINKLMK